MAEGGIGLARSQESIDDPDSTSQASQHILKRIKSDRVAVTKGEDDRRRRTIIVEKKNGTYGFTLQSYGIHYKKEHEVEKITYVDYVEYDGPAYKSGMREGDVILSINGTEMDKSNHKALVTFIKNCDTRMRMVVLFEDCVRKVELHMRYIQLQNVLQAKMNELERTCLKERELLDGKWKTHSLPAPRKKAGTTSATGVNTTPSDENLAATTPDSDGFTATATRPISTEDVNLIRAQRHQVHVIPPPAQFMLTYQYLDPRCRYILKPSTSSGGSGEYLLSIGPPTRSKSEHQEFYVAADGSVELPPQMNPSSSSTTSRRERCKRDGETEKSTKSRHCHGHSCNPCVGHKKDKHNNGDNVSLDAYDLANPCCTPQCVPTSSRRRTKHKHKHREKDSKEHRTRSQSHANPATHCSQTNEAVHHSQSNEKHQSHRRLYDLSNQLASRCSLHSCISSSEFDGGVADNSMASYSTSLSTDTLYWDPKSDASATSSRQHSTKSHQSIPNPSSYQQQRNTVAGVIVVPQTKQIQHTTSHRHHHHHHQRRYHHVHASSNTPTVKSKHTEIVYGSQAQAQAHIQYIQQKPKSWDNLAMKAIGGYGFGYAAPKSQTSHANATGTRYVASGTQPRAHSTHVAIQHRRPIASSSIERLSMPNNQQRHSIPRKNAFGRYSTLDIENYAPPPSQFVQEFATATTTTTSITKSTENLLSNAVAYNVSDSSINSACDCNLIEAQNKILRQNAQPNECLGYYSHLPQTIVCTTSNGAVPKQTNGTINAKVVANNNVATISEITRL